MFDQRKITKGSKPCGGFLPLDTFFPRMGIDKQRVVLLVPSSVGHHDLPTGHGVDVSRRKG